MMIQGIINAAYSAPPTVAPPVRYRIKVVNLERNDSLVRVGARDVTVLEASYQRGVSYRYRIKAVNSDGTATWFGPVRAD